MEFYMYWLSTLQILGSRRQNFLLEYFGNAQEAFYASNEAICAVPGLAEHNINAILESRDKDKVKSGMEILQKMGILFTYRGGPDYPSLLAEIPDAPVGLFYLGRFPDDSLPRVAIIGSRRCSEYGLSTARRFGAALTGRGIVIVSGMARGIDSMAHRGALEGEGPSVFTIAVLGCGVDICYPAENCGLRDAIAKNGCVISEYPPGTKPLAAHFPARNRIISGLSKVVVVVEAGKRSGTLITVDQAHHQGRDVMAVPGNITNKYSEGTNELIKQGAEPACNYEDILHMLGIWENKTKKPAEKRPDIATDEKLVYDVLAPHTPLTIEELIVKTNSKPQTVQYVLTMLEIKGYVKKMPGMRYIKI